MARMTLDDLVTQLRAAYGTGLQSVVLYGSAAAGEHIPKRSDYNVLVIVTSLAPDTLRAASAVSRAWSEAGNPAPLTLTAAEWRGSADIFPMEYADILARHRVLHGAPPFDGIRVDPRDLRLHLEQEAMGKLLRLRQGVLAPSSSSCRALVRLHGTEPPTDNTALSEAAARLAEFDAAPFVRVVRHVRGEAKIGTQEAEAILAGYLRGVEQLVSHLDRYAAAP